MKVSLLISTYNWPEALKIVLQSVEGQTIKPNEILIADDGSTAETKNLIKSFSKKSEIKYMHFWQEDEGFRKAIILNRAIAGSSFNYIIQVDGDCILHKDFIKDHIALAQLNTYLYGSRVNIKQRFLPQLFRNEIKKFPFYAAGIKKRSRNLRIPSLAKLYVPSPIYSEKMRGCNVSFWKKDVLAVNGYNENFKGWGREDSELVIRMMNNGVLGKRLKYAGIVYHIWHATKDISSFLINDALQEEAIFGKHVWCENGIDKYLK